MISIGIAAAECLRFGRQVLLGVAVVTALFGARALGADLDLRAPPAALPNWSGLYVGIGVGARANAVDANATSATVGTPPVPIALPIAASGDPNALAFWQQQQGAQQYLDTIALRGGIYAGWNFQMGPSYVMGVEADFAYANETASFHGSPYPANLIFGTPTPLPLGASPTDSLRLTTRWDASLRLRGGWLATPFMLLYLTGGLAWANVEAQSTCSPFSTPGVSNCAPGNYFSGTLGPDVITHTQTRLGWTLGAGAEICSDRNGWLASSTASRISAIPRGTAVPSLLQTCAFAADALLRQAVH